jgi:hypothetical protein
MKNFLPRYYHLVLLGLAVLLALSSAAILTTQFRDFQDSFSTAAGNSKGSGDATTAPSTNAVIAMEKLKKPPVWPLREDGASPMVSRPYLLRDGKLIDPMEGTEPLYPPVPNQWLIDHQLDYTDVNILERDPKHKGFTVREEFESGTDPNNPKQFPPLYTKLSYADADIRKSNYTLEFLGEEENEGRKEYMIRPLQPLPNPAKGDRLDNSVRQVVLGAIVPGAPFLKVVELIPKKKTINDTEFDVSELILENTLTGERHALVQKSTSREYRKKNIELVESVTFHYQLAGAPREDITVERGKELTLGSLDKNYTETYKLVDFSSAGILLNKDGKSFTVKPSALNSVVPTPSPTVTPSPAP